MRCYLRFIWQNIVLKKAVLKEEKSAWIQSACLAWSRSGRVESVVKVDTPVKNVKVVMLLCAGALCQELHIFIWGRGMSEDNPRDLSHNWMRRMGDQGGKTRKSCKRVCNLFLFLSERRLPTAIVCFPACKDSFFSLDKTWFGSFVRSAWDTKRRNTMCENRAWCPVKRRS